MKSLIPPTVNFFSFSKNLENFSLNFKFRKIQFFSFPYPLFPPQSAIPRKSVSQSRPHCTLIVMSPWFSLIQNKPLTFVFFYFHDIDIFEECWLVITQKILQFRIVWQFPMIRLGLYVCASHRVTSGARPVCLSGPW